MRKSLLRKHGIGAALCLVGAALLFAGTAVSLGYVTLPGE